MKKLQSEDKLLVLIGASATGKSTLAHQLQMRQLIEIMPTYTTRPPRDDLEAKKGQHIFVNDDEFKALQDKGAFLEVAQPFGLSFMYGCPPLTVHNDGAVPTLLLRVFLLDLLKKHYKNLTVYQIECDEDTAAKRLRRRGKSPIGTRLDMFNQEQTMGRTCANRIFTNNSDSSLESIIAQLKQAIHDDF